MSKNLKNKDKFSQMTLGTTDDIFSKESKQNIEEHQYKQFRQRVTHENSNNKNLSTYYHSKNKQKTQKQKITVQTISKSKQNIENNAYITPQFVVTLKNLLVFITSLVYSCFNKNIKSFFQNFLFIYFLDKDITIGAKNNKQDLNNTSKQDKQYKVFVNGQHQQFIQIEKKQPFLTSQFNDDLSANNETNRIKRKAARKYSEQEIDHEEQLKPQRRLRRPSFQEQQYVKIKQTKNNDFMSILRNEFFNNFMANQQSKKNHIKKPFVDSYQTYVQKDRFKNCFVDIKEINCSQKYQTFKAMHKLEQQYYVIKKIPIFNKDLQEFRKTTVYQRLSQILHLKNDKIQKYLTSWIENPQQNDETQFYLFIQMEYISGISLQDYLEQKQKADHEQFTYYLFRQLLDGLRYLHSKKIVHKDLKPQNIIVTKSGIKICNLDFLDCNLIENHNHIEELSIDYSNLYKSPEQIKGLEATSKSDMFSFGLIVYQCLVQINKNEDILEQFQNIRMSNQVDLNLKKEKQIRSAIVEALIQNDPEKRISASDLKNSREYFRWPFPKKNKIIDHLHVQQQMISNYQFYYNLIQLNERKIFKRRLNIYIR